jgi:hypothetical protein
MLVAQVLNQNLFVAETLTAEIDKQELSKYIQALPSGKTTRHGSPSVRDWHSSLGKHVSNRLILVRLPSDEIC